MNKQEALEYYYKHRDEYISDMYACGENGIRQFACLIEILKSDIISPDELVDYGMDY